MIPRELVRSCGLTHSPLNLRALLEYAKDPAARDLAVCQKMIDDCYNSEDYKEGQAAFMEKRKPVFQGR